MRHLPRYVHGYLDRHGKPRHYFRRPGFKQLALPGLPFSAEFMAAYAEAMAGQVGIKQEIGARHIIPGTMRALGVSYFQSSEFLSLRASTQKIRRWEVESICKRACRGAHRSQGQQARSRQRAPDGPSLAHAACGRYQTA
jgi:hypothetical protein